MSEYVPVIRDALVADQRPLVRSAQAVRELVGPDMAELAQEQMRVILLSTRLAVIDVVTVYQGTIDTCLVRQAELFRPAIVQNAPSIILVHNHPSGDAKPSAEDRAMTEQAREAGAILQIGVLDHVIVARSGAVSLRELMPWSISTGPTGTQLGGGATS